MLGFVAFMYVARISGVATYYIMVASDKAAELRNRKAMEPKRSGSHDLITLEHSLVCAHRERTPHIEMECC